MFRNYLKIAFRNMQRQKLYTAVNIGGFAISIAACLIIALYIKHELSYDRQIAHSDRVYRILGVDKSSGTPRTATAFPPPMAKALLNDFPQIEKAGRIMPNTLFGGANNQVRRVDQEHDNYETGFCFADPSIMDILDIKMVYGNRETALSEPNTIVLCKSLADKYFPHQDPVGKLLIFNDNTRRPLKVGGVIQDFPSTSHLQYRSFISLSGLSFWPGEQEGWGSSNYPIYLLLKPGTNVPQLEKAITSDVLNKYMVPMLKSMGRADIQRFVNNAYLILQPVTRIHLYSHDVENDYAKPGDIRFVWLFAAIAVFILILACINFINLSTARSATRAKEVGVRKVMGSFRTDLIWQFLSESLLCSLLSFFLAIIIAAIVLPYFNQMAGTALAIPWKEWTLIPLLLLAAVVIGLLAGLYPAFYLSYFKPVNVLKGKLNTGRRPNGGLRSGLVVLQFTISALLLTGTLIIYRQMQFILHSKIGFDKDQVVMIENTRALGDQAPSFKNELRRLPFVKNVTVSDFLPVDGIDIKRNGNTFWKEGKTKEEAGVIGQRWEVDDHYIPTLGIKLLVGRNFSKDMPTDSQACIINKAMADQIGFRDPVGQTLTNGGDPRKIIGVVDNFHFESMKQRVLPLCMVLGGGRGIVSVKVNAASMKEVLSAIRQIWQGFVPHQELRYEFMDQSYAAMYADVERAGRLFTGFGILAIVIACLGLFALSAFMAEQRKKEIGVRKVLGASVMNLFTLLAGNFLKLICISLLIAIPIGWLLMNKWLQDFAYRVSIGWDVFALSAVAMLIIAVTTVCFQALKAAVANPVESLRSE